MQRENWMESERYKKFNQKKVVDLTKDDFIYYFTLFLKEISSYDFKQLKEVDSVLNYYDIVADLNSNKFITDEEVSNLYEKVISSSIYISYKEKEFLLNYPLCEESLYQLELDYISFLRNKNATLKEYKNILEILFFLLPVASEKTIYIVHNILLYYKFGKMENEGKEKKVAALYEELCCSKVYQKLKNSH